MAACRSDFDDRSSGKSIPGTERGVLNYYKANEAYLQGQLGNPKGEDQPNKKYYDPRVWLRAGQTSMIARLEKAFQELNAIDVL